MEDEASTLLHRQNHLPEMSDLTNEEREIGALANLLTSIVCCATASTFESQQELLAFVERWLDEIQDRISSISEDLTNAVLLPVSPELKVPHWNYYHWAYITFDGLHLIQDAFKEVEALYKPKDKTRTLWFRETRSKFDEKGKKLLGSLQQVAVKLRIPLEQRGAVRELRKASLGRKEDLEDSVGHELRRAVDNDLVEQLAKRMLSSWKIGLDGVRKFFDEGLRV